MNLFRALYVFLQNDLSFAFFPISVMRRFWPVSTAVLLFLLVILYGVSELMLKISLRPDNSSFRSSTVAWDVMKSDYPHIAPWLDSLQREGACRDTVVWTEDSVPLHALYVGAARQGSCRPTAVLVHGYQDSAIRMLHLGKMYHRDMGWNILLPDLRYHGDTPGKAVQMGWHDRLDVLRWIGVAENLFYSAADRDSAQIVLHGISMGAATTMMVSGEPRVSRALKAFVEDCGYTSVWDVFAHQLREQYSLPAFPVMHTTDLLCQARYGWSFEEASALEAVGRCRLPMLFIHGGADRFVPTEMVYRLYRAKPAPKALWVLPGVVHAMSYHDRPEEYTARVRRFLSPYIR